MRPSLHTCALYLAITMIAAWRQAPAEEPRGSLDGSHSPPTTLRLAFSRDFLVGTALNRMQLLGSKADMLDLAARQFNAVTAENATKWERIHPLEGEFDWEAADALVKFAAANDMHVTGHVLLWHSQTPAWVFEDPDGKQASRELLLARLKNHIDTVVSRYAGKVDEWEVVNEALDEDGTLRQTPWLKIIGDDYIARAFQYAHEADPDADLYLNDFNLYKPAKRAGAIRLVKALQDQGIEIDGIGMQGHYGLDWPTNLGDVEASIEAFGDLGLAVYITELDISVLPFPTPESQGADLSVNLALQARYNPYTDGLPPAVEQQQIDRYTGLFRILLAHRDVVRRVTFWGLDDAQSWKNNWPMHGRTDYPLLFDRQGQPKKVFYEVVKLAGDG